MSKFLYLNCGIVIVEVIFEISSYIGDFKMH